jgi:general secretion pathway protein A
VAGSTSEVFTPGALAELHRLSKGIPRVINVLADRALLGAYSGEQHRVTPALVRDAAAEVYGRTLSRPWLRWALAGVGVAGAALLAFGLWLLVQSLRPAAAPARPAPVASATPPTPAKPAPAPAGPSTAPLGPLLATAGGGTDDAFARLFALWKVPFDRSAARPCEQATAQGLACIAQRGTARRSSHSSRPTEPSTRSSCRSSGTSRPASRSASTPTRPT